MSVPDYKVVSRERMITVECAMEDHQEVRAHFSEIGYPKALRTGPKPIGPGHVDPKIWQGILSGSGIKIIEGEE